MNMKTIKTLALSAALIGAGAAFAEDAYIESDGTQAVNLGYYASENTKIVIDFQITEWGTARAVFGPVYNDSGMSSSLWINGNGDGGLEPKMGNKWGGSFTIPADDKLSRFRVVWDGPAKKVHLYGTGDETLIGTRDCSACTVTGVSNRPLTLFASANGASGESYSYNSKCRIFSVQIYENGELKRDYRPALKGGAEGFYDGKTGMFATDAQHALAYGGDIPTIEDDPYVSTPDGGVNVDTGYICTENTRVECDFAMLSTANDQYVFSCSGGAFFRAYFGLSNEKVVQNWGCGNTSSTKLLARQNVRHTLLIDSYADVMALMTGGATNYTVAVSTVRKDVTGPSSALGIGGHHGGDYASCFAKMRLYGFRIYEKGVLKHDYVPRKCEGAGILKDLVTGKVIFSRTSTPLSFGGAVTEDPYVESRGLQRIDVNYYPNAKTHIEVDYAITKYSTSAWRYLFGLARSTTDGVSKGLLFGTNSGGSQEFSAHGVWSSGFAGKPDGKRHTAIIDQPSGWVYVATGGHLANSTSDSKDMSTRSGYIGTVGTSTTKLGLFGSSETSTMSSQAEGARIYCVSILEDGEVVRKYEPYVKDGVVGFRDAITGEFATTAYTDTGKLPLTIGGQVEYEGATDAYVESDGTQYVDLAVAVGANTRLDVDFQVMSTNRAVGVFNLLNNSSLTSALLWVNGSGSIESNMGGWLGGFNGVTLRRRISYDVKGQKVNIYEPGAAEPYNTKNGKGVVTSTGVRLFQAYSSVGFGSLRIFSFRVYENDVLTHEFLPYKKGDTIGFYDTKVPGSVAVNGRSGGHAFKYGGMGVDGQGSAFVIEPQDGTAPIEGTATLTAYAPGALSYVWTKDGAPVAGGENGELTVEWQRRPRQVGYAVTPVYNVFGAEEKGEPSSATVTNEPLGACLIIR